VVQEGVLSAGTLPRVGFQSIVFKQTIGLFLVCTHVHTDISEQSAIGRECSRVYNNILKYNPYVEYNNNNNMFYLSDVRLFTVSTRR